MEFAVCSLAIGDEYKQSVRLCTESQEAHSKKHGYTRITDESVYDPLRPHAWSKIRLLQKYLESYNYLMWIDADVLIMNQERTIEEYIRLLPADKFILVGRDINNLNTGVIILRNCPLAHEFLKDVWNKTEYLNHEWWEQAAIIDLYGSPKYRSSFEVIPRKYISIMNAFDFRIDSKVHWRPGDFCIHFAGIHHRESLVQVQDMYARFASTDPGGNLRIENYIRERDEIKQKCSM